MEASQIRGNIMVSIAPLPDGATEIRALVYTAPNARRFKIKDFGEGNEDRYCLQECVPSRLNPGAIYARSFPGCEERLEHDERIKKLIDNPNEFWKECERFGVVTNKIVLEERNVGIGTKYYSSLLAVAEAINEAMQKNNWYECYDCDLSDTIFNSTEYQEHEDFIIEQALECTRALNEYYMSDQGIFKGAHNENGLLSDEIKFEILSYINDPTEEKWDKIHEYVISESQNKTLLQAWLEIDTSAPMHKCEGRWSKIPTGEQTKEAIRHTCLP